MNKVSVLVTEVARVRNSYAALLENVEETVKSAVSAGGTLLQNPKTKPWGQVVAYIRDIDGFLIEICTPMG